MALNKGFARNAATDAVDARLMDAAVLMRNADGSVRTGILQTVAPNANPVTATSSMAVAVASSDFITSRGVGDGAYRLSNVGTVNVTLATAPTANSRYDVVYVKQNDSTAGDASDTAVIDKVTGTAASSPAVPAVPTGALALATILIPANVTATNAGGVVVTNVAQLTAPIGSPVPYRSATDLVNDAANVPNGSTAIEYGFYGRYTKVGSVWFFQGNVFGSSLYNANGSDLSFAGGSANASRQSFSFNAQTASRVQIKLRMYQNSQSSNVAANISLQVNGSSLPGNAIRIFSNANTGAVVFETWDTYISAGSNTVALFASSDSGSGTVSWSYLRWEVLAY